MAAYSRQSTFTDGDTISASLFNNEYDALAAAFVNTSGHKHDGTTGEGPVIGLIGDANIATPLNKVLIDTTNDHIEFYVDVSSSSVQQAYIADGVIAPVTDSDVDLGTSSLYFKNAFIDAITTTGNVAVGGNLTVTGNTTFNGGTQTLGDAATDNVVFGADVNSSIIPNTDNSFDLGSTSQEWKDIYIDGVAYLDEINFNGTAITSTAAELNILDGVTATATEINALDGITSTVSELNILDGVTASAADINLIDGITNGTVIASKAIITDSNKDITGGRNITISGELDAATLDISGDADIDGTLEADAITVNGTALSTVITGTTVSTVTVSDSTANTNFPVVFHDESNALLDDTGALRYNPSTGTLLVPNLSVAGTTTTVDTVTMNAANAIIFEGATPDGNETTLSIIDPTGDRTINLPNVSGTLPVLAAASTTQITSTPEELNILDGVTSTATELNILDGVTSTTAELNILDGVTSTATELNLVDGITAGTVSASKAVIVDSDKDISGFRNVTVTGELDGATLDISGDADIDGTTNLDNTDIDGTLVVDGSNISLDSTSTLNIDNSNTSNGITIGTATSGVPVSIGHSTSETTINDNLTVTGDLTVSGTTTTVNSTTVNLNDHNIVLDSGNSTSAVINGGGITLEGGSGDDATFTYNTSGPKFELKLGSSHEDLQVDKLTADGGVVVDNITIDGTEIDLSSGNLTVDVAGEIHLDSDGGIIRFKDAATDVGTFENVSSDFIIKSSISDQDLIFKGNDGGSAITALTLDMSDAGAATFTSSVTSGSFLQANGHISTGSNSGRLRAGASNEIELSHDGSHGELDVDTGNLTIDVAGDINLDAGGSDISLQGSGAEYGKFNLSGNSLNIHSSISDGDIVFKGSDGGSAITALTLDMSDAGTATFNHDIALGDDSIAKFGDSGELNIYHHNNGSSYIQETGGGDLQLLATEFRVMNAAGTENKILATTDGSVDLYHDNVKKFETTSSGIDVTGLVEFDSLSGTGSVAITDIADEDDMSSDSATLLATQQSIKAYADTKASAGFAVAMAIAL